MDGKANKEVSKSAVDREKRKRGGEGADRGKGRKEKKGIGRTERKSAGEETVHLNSHHVSDLRSL